MYTFEIIFIFEQINPLNESDMCSYKFTSEQIFFFDPSDPLNKL